MALERNETICTLGDTDGNFLCIAAHSWSRDGSDSCSEVLQVYVQAKQNQYASAGGTIGWSYPVYWEH